MAKEPSVELLTIINESVGTPQDKLITRPRYLPWLKAKLDNHLIKVISGFRRVGKSTLLKQLYFHLHHEQQVPKTNLFFLNYEHALLANQTQSQDLYHLFARFEREAQSDQPIYLFLDEIQNVENWESFVRTLYEKDKQRYNIYLTGSNSSLLSSEFTSALGGRTVDLQVHPFSFAEFLAFHDLSVKDKWAYVEQKLEIEALLDQFLAQGGLPETADFEPDLTQEYLQSTLKKVLLDDIVKRFHIEKSEILENIFYYTITNTSSVVSYRSIARYLKQQEIKASSPTIKRYIDHYIQAFALSKIARFSWKTKSVFRQLYKYYPVDHAFINYFSLNRQRTQAKALECVVLNQLLRQGKQIYYGRDTNTNRELDFIVSDPQASDSPGNLQKIQVTLELNQDNEKRELGNFAIADKYLQSGENLVITRHGEARELEYKGVTIKQQPLAHFLLTALQS
jgi:hypothetical protein